VKEDQFKLECEKPSDEPELIKIVEEPTFNGPCIISIDPKFQTKIKTDEDIPLKKNTESQILMDTKNNLEDLQTPTVM